MLRRNISDREGSCRCERDCKKVASFPFLDRVQELRDRAGESMRFTSITRCIDHNADIGGVDDSPHLLSADPGPYGAVDIACTDPAKRWTWILIALALGFNHIEVCDKHLHFAFVPEGHRLKNFLNWWKSK